VKSRGCGDVGKDKPLRERARVREKERVRRNCGGSCVIFFFRPSLADG
jgi:hypothetical protein